MRRSLLPAAAAISLLCPASAAAEDHARLHGALAAAMDRASPQSGAYVYDLSEGRRLFARRPGTRRIIASNAKLFTTGAALDRFGPRARFPTEVLADRRPGSQGVVRGRLYLRGGGDPSFGTDSFTRRAYGGGGATVGGLARAVERAGVREVRHGIFGDETLFDSLRGGPDSGYGTSPWVGPLSALAFNRGLARERGAAFQSDPPRFAAAKLAAALERRGIRVRGPVGVAAAPGEARPLAEIDSMPLARLATITNNVSDNFFAEILVKHLDVRAGHRATTSGGSARAARFARRLGARVRLVDGSGLARGNLAAPRAVARYLRAMRMRPHFRAFYRSLALPGRPGTLSERMRRGAARRGCRGKTGTIRGVSNLSGYCETRSGDLVAFSILMNGVGSYDRARDLQDRMAQAIARHG